VLLRRLLRLRLRRLRRLLPPELPDLLLLSPPDAAGTICVNFAISLSSCFVEPRSTLRTL
jgi:hypothetical protein